MNSAWRQGRNGGHTHRDGSELLQRDPLLNFSCSRRNPSVRKVGCCLDGENGASGDPFIQFNPFNVRNLTVAVRTTSWHLLPNFALFDVILRKLQLDKMKTYFHTAVPNKSHRIYW
jgi:hypothetical protein